MCTPAPPRMALEEGAFAAARRTADEATSEPVALDPAYAKRARRRSMSRELGLALLALCLGGEGEGGELGFRCLRDASGAERVQEAPMAAWRINFASRAGTARPTW
jgi:hypothetical protein